MQRQILVSEALFRVTKVGNEIFVPPVKSVKVMKKLHSVQKDNCRHTIMV
jgi:hypothetical protein